MNTLEYLQLTYKQKIESDVIIRNSEYLGLFIDNNRVRDWYRNGTLHCEYHVENNNEHGIMKIWDDEGRLKVHKLYENGKLIKDYLNK